MISHVASVAIYVHDQDRAKQFYTETLGFELRMDVPMYPGAPMRWLAVAPKGATTEVILMTLDEHSAHFEAVLGQTQAMIFNVPDMAQTVDDLKAKGVRFTMDPDVQPWGTWTLIEDSEGNKLMLVQPTQM